MTIKHLIAPPLGAAIRLIRKITRPPHLPFHTIILHDVPENLLGALSDYLDRIARDHGFVTPSEAETLLNSTVPIDESDRPAPCLITVDDGFASARKIGCEILTQYGAEGIFFVCPGLISASIERQKELIGTNVFDGHPPPQRPNMMSWGDVEDLLHAGQTIGAHGFEHKRLASLSGDALAAEIIESRVELERRLGTTPHWYAYAFGDIKSISAPALRVIRENFRYCRSGIRGENQRGSEPVLFAQEIDLSAPAAYQRSILNGALNFRYVDDRRRLLRYWHEASRLSN